jgi:hypothetical protein
MVPRAHTATEADQRIAAMREQIKKEGYHV